MDNQPLISVIVPIYKVEDYLDRCVDSIVNQTYRNLEIILVDDGSPDNCPRICDDWGNKDSRIKVIHKENGGLSDARNAGMKIASGKYISFIDSDDYVSLDFFETLLFVAQRENSDVVECDTIKFYQDGRFDAFRDDLSVNTYNTENALSGLIEEKQFRQHVWNKLYKYEVVKSIPFAFGKLNEDEFWTYQVFGNAKKATKINKTMYYYFQRSDSIMGENYNIRRLDALEGKANRQKYMELLFPQLALKAKIDYYGSCIYSYQCVLKYLPYADKRKASKIIFNHKRTCNLTLQEISTIQSSSKKYFYLAKINFYCCCKIRTILGIGF